MVLSLWRCSGVYGFNWLGKGSLTWQVTYFLDVDPAQSGMGRNPDSAAISKSWY